MQDLTTAQQIALVVSPALAAVAAGASWASVFQARRFAREATSPLLQVQITAHPDQTIGAVVTNAGGGMARGAGICLVYPPYVAAASLVHGFMQPGDTHHVVTDIAITTPDVATSVVVHCRDKYSFPHYWSANEDHYVGRTRWPQRRPRYRDIRESFMELYPDVNPYEMHEAKMGVLKSLSSMPAPGVVSHPGGVP
jgi:hypothetical protein